MRRAVWMAVAVALVSAAAFAAGDDDPYLWLADIHGEKALAWVKAQDAKSDAALKSDPTYAADFAAIKSSLDTKDRIALGQLDHGRIVNFWQDANHVRGLWRRATMAEYRKPDPHWDVLLDVDKLDAEQNKDWVFQGGRCTASDKRCLVRLSPGGGDASEVREFDPGKHQFVAGGFTLPAAKSSAAYVDDNTILFATDFGSGTMTKSSYPRIMKIWHRGQPISAAKQVFEVGPDDIAVRPIVLHGPGGITNAKATVLIERGVSFFENEYSFMAANGKLTKLPLPLGADLQGAIKGNLIFKLRHAWDANGTTYKEGSLIMFPLREFLNTHRMPKIALLAAPDAHSMVDTVATGRDAVYAAIYRDVTGSIHAFRPGKHGWSDSVLDLPKGGSTTVVSADDWGSRALFTYESFLVPATLYEYDGHGEPRAIKSQPPLFDASDMVSEQFWVSSSDGVKVPYFLIHKKGHAHDVPTILYGYGGFELSLTPWSGTTDTARSTPDRSG